MKWDRNELARRSTVPLDVIVRAESVDGTPSITLVQGTLLQTTLEQVGVEFFGLDRTGVRLKTKGTPE